MIGATVFAPCTYCGRRMATNHDANGRPRLYCSDVCRQRACRKRHKTIVHGAISRVNDSAGGATATYPELKGMKLSADCLGMRDAAISTQCDRIDAQARRCAGMRFRCERDAARAESLKRSNLKEQNT
jgi:hypothetical protein